MVLKQFNYGSTVVPVQFRKNVTSLCHKEPPPLADPFKIESDLRSYLNTLEKSFSNAGIVVCDKSRLSQYPTYLPVLTKVLGEYGLHSENITFYIAYGTHARQTEAESLFSYGETFNQFRFVHHDSHAKDRLLSLGTTKRGTDVKIMKEVLEHDLLITFGAILHHYFAGYGGGRKLLFPGLAGYDSILQNHQQFLDFEKKSLKKGCQSGNLDSNPLALDLEEINTLLPERLEIFSILNSRREVCELLVGTGYMEYRNVCQQYDYYFKSDNEQMFDMVVASAGGYPKDINFIQAHKSIHNAAAFVKDDGILIIFAECIDGIGNQSFMNLFRLGGKDKVFENMALNYANNAGTAVAMMDKTSRINIHFVTSLDQETCDLMCTIKTSTEKAKQMALNESRSVAWIENASLLYR